MGLVYRAGRVRPDAAATRAGRAGRAGRWVVKVQPPLDSSSDSRGGMGRSDRRASRTREEGTVHLPPNSGPRTGLYPDRRQVEACMPHVS